ncbi:MAG: DUF2993 domain-containing protein [Acidimicrobiales bacterium]
MVGLLVAADVGARAAAEAQLESRIRSSVPGATSASVSIRSFPFLGRLAVSGHVPELRATAAGVTVSRLRLDSITVDLHDVQLDRGRLLRDRQVDILGIGRGLATADVTQADLRSALDGLPVVLGNGTISVSVGSVRARVTATVKDNVLRLSAAGFTAPPLTIPKLPLLPCVTQAVAVPGRLHLDCAVDQVPQELLRRVNSTISG